MSFGARPKRAFLAYCALAARLSAGAGISQALVPFLAEVCRQFPGDVFDAGKFSNAVNERFGFSIPRLAALGLAEQLADEGLLVEISGHASKSVYRYASDLPQQDAVPSLTEGEVERVLQKFEHFCRADEHLAAVSQPELHDGLLERLLHVDSMRLLSRREGSVGAKRTAATLTLGPKPQGAAVVDHDTRELHLDFAVSQFLLDLREQDPAAFEQVSNVAFANMAAEAIACFSEDGSAAPLNGLMVYLDSPLLLDVLGVNAEYAEYGAELLEAIKASGAHPAVQDHSVTEAENTISARIAFLRSGINKVSTAVGSNTKLSLVTALSGNVAARLEEMFGIAVHRDPEVHLHRRAPSAVGDIQAAMDEQMQAWRKDDAREHDQRSVWQMLAIRNSSDPCPKVCDCRWLFVTRNTSLVRIANRAWTTWLKGVTSHSSSHIDRWAPVAMSDKQFAGYLWARSGGGVAGSIPRARLLAHCSAAVRPRADLKARAYNMVLEHQGSTEAEYFAALLEDREGAKALMRASRGDPEDVTPQRLSYIMDVVKRAAGEYATEKVREEFNAEREALVATHANEIAAAAARAAAEAAAKAEQEANVQHAAEIQSRDSVNQALAEAVRQQENVERARRVRATNAAFRQGRRTFSLLRWGFVAVLGAGAYTAASISSESPALSALVSAVVTMAGVWFVPEYLNAPLTWAGRKSMAMELRRLAPDLVMPQSSEIDFRKPLGSTSMPEGEDRVA